MSRRILALAGPKGSGKSTAAQLLHQKHKFYNTSFTWPIKRMLIELLFCGGMSATDAAHAISDQKEVPLDALGGRTPRHAMQTLGTEWRDLMSQSLWLDIWQARILAPNMQSRDIVVDDLRFALEAHRVRAFGGKVVLIHREQALTADSHISEQEWKTIPFDAVVRNDGLPDEMLPQLEALL